MIGEEVNNPLVSILMPCCNVKAYLPKCMDTILGQSYCNLQIVLIDDGSKDATWSVMQEYAAKDARIEIYHQENQGVAAARNNLLEKIKGDYVLFIDSDDWIELDMVGHLVTLAADQDSPFIMCDRVINDAKSRTTPEIVHKLSQEEAVHDFLRHEYFVGSLCNKLIKTSLLHNLKFHCGISYGEDALFCWHVLQNTPNVVVTDRQFYHYRMNEGSISHSSFGQKKLSGHLTWKIISGECEKYWPQFVDLSYSQWALQDIDLLHAACREGYKGNDDLKQLQKTVITYFRALRSSDRTSLYKLSYGWVVSRFLFIGRLFKII